MAYLRDRRAFGNIGTRKFRGARFGDPLSPRGPQYTLEGRVLDYSTDAGPFTIVDQSGEGNTATLYSGRGLTMDAVNDTVTYDTTYTSASRTATVWMRVTALGARTLNGATGTFTFTPTATNVWEELSSTATVSGDLAWTAGSDCDIGDLTCATEHWTHNDWSDPTGDTSNGKTIVDSGANQLHGTCTGCSGFTGEGIDPLFVPITDETLPYFAGDNAASVGFSDVTFAGDLAVSFKTHIIDLDGTSGTIDGAHFLADNGGSTRIYFDSSVSGGGAVSIADGAGNTSVWQSESALVAGVDYDIQITRISGVWNLTINGVDKATPSVNNASGTLTLNSWGSKRGATTSITALNGVIYDINLGSAAWGGGTPYTDTIGTNNGTPSGTFVTVGQKRATIPQTADKNWNKYQTLGAELVNDWTTRAYVTPNGDLSLSNTNAVNATWGCDIPDGSSGDAVIIRGTCVSVTSSPLFTLRDNAGTIRSETTNTVTTTGDFELTMNATSSYQRLYVSEGSADMPSSVVFSNLRVITPDGNALISESDANDQIDALGTAISEPRLNTQQLNLFGEGEYSSTPDSASLDVTTTATWELWGNFYGDTGATEIIFSKDISGAANRGWNINKSVGAAANRMNISVVNNVNNGTVAYSQVGLLDQVQHVVYTFTSGVFKCYVDSVEVTLTKYFGVTPTSSLPNVSYPVMIGTFNDPTPSAFAARAIGSAKIYNVALTADEVLTNYNTQKSLYGL
jgi:hypothetical protein